MQSPEKKVFLRIYIRPSGLSYNHIGHETINVQINNVAENKATRPDGTSYYKVCYWKTIENKWTIETQLMVPKVQEIYWNFFVIPLYSKQILITSKIKQAVFRSFYSGHSSVTVDIRHSSHTLDSGHRSNTIV